MSKGSISYISISLGYECCSMFRKRGTEIRKFQSLLNVFDGNTAV